MNFKKVEIGIEKSALIQILNILIKIRININFIVPVI